MIDWEEWNRYWHKRMPALDWLANYNLRRDLKYDFIAGFTVAVMLVPQEMSFASLMGVPAQYGLYTAAIAPLLYPLFGSSRAMSIANTSDGSLLVGVLLRSVEIKSMEERVATGILLTFFAGFFMVCSGFLHQGGAVSFFSRTSMNGYTAATSILIIISQLRGWLGITLHKNSVLTIFTMIEAMGELPHTNMYSFALGVFSLVFLLITKRLKSVLASIDEHTKKHGFVVSNDATTSLIKQEVEEAQDGNEEEVIESGGSENGSAVVVPMLQATSEAKSITPSTKPSCKFQGLRGFFVLRPRLALFCSVICDGGAFIMCLLGMGFGAAVGENTIKLTGVVPGGLPMPVFPPSVLGDVVPWDRLQSIVTHAAVIAMIFFMSTFAAGKKLANQAGYEISPNQELLGLGFANFGSSFFQGMPSSAGLSRSAVASQNAHTPLASMVTAILVAVTLLFLTGPLYYLPQAPMAAIIMLSSYRLLDFSEPRWLKRVNRHDFYVWLASFCATLLCGLVQGLIISVVASLIPIMVKSKKPRVVTLGQLPDGSFGDVDDPDTQATELQDILIVHMAHTLYFGNASHFIHGIEHKLREAKARGHIIGIVVDGSRMNSIDASSILALKDYYRKLLARDQQLTFANLQLEIAASLLASGLWASNEADDEKKHQQRLMGDIATAVAFVRSSSY